jgi:intein/homing endonuclease
MTARHELRKMAPVRDTCFAAGTLVHTKEGLKPIETIKAGDWVLSRPEENSGENAYKRVIRTTCHENQAVWRVNVFDEKREAYNAFIVTPNHPFYVDGPYSTDYRHYDPVENLGWRRADSIVDNDGLLLMDGSRTTVGLEYHGLAPIWKTDQEGIGWIYAWDRKAQDSDGRKIDLRNGKIEEENRRKYPCPTDLGYHENGNVISVGGLMEGYDPEAVAQWAYLCTVYNLEVEDYHTYFVGEMGVWVHNCPEPLSGLI